MLANDDGPSRTSPKLGKRLRQLGEAELPEPAAHRVTTLDVHHLDAVHTVLLLCLTSVWAPVHEGAIGAQHRGVECVSPRSPPRLAGLFGAHTVSSVAVAAAGDV